VTSPTRASDRASYRYDKAGNPIRRTEMGLGVTNSFNNLNQIVSGIWTGGAITVAGAVNYAAGTVTVAGIKGTIYPDRTFDVTNVTVTAGTNILTAVYHGPPFTNTQMIATDKVTVIVGNAAYTHDANGNLTGDQNFTYQYDLANRLTNVILKASNVSVFAASYDGLGRRIQVVRNGTTTERYVYLPGSFLVLAILDGSNAVKEFYTHGPDLSGTVGGAGGIGGILAAKYPQQTNAPTYFLHLDAMGHVVLATDQQGKEIGQYRYSPFGRLLNHTGAFTSRFKYSSKEHDSESGLINFGYRWYDPTTGRWLSRDPINEPGAGMPANLGQRGETARVPPPSSPLAEALAIFLAETGLDANDGSDGSVIPRPDQGNLYIFVKNQPSGLVDPDGRDIYVIKGNNTWNPINNALHRKLCVDTWSDCKPCGDCENKGSVKSGKVCFSYGAIPWFPLVGIVYNDTYTGGTIVRQQKTRCIDDLFIAGYLWGKVGDKGVYSPYDNCITWSESGFDHLIQKYKLDCK
jgi:RHS repeat-associated protein